MKGPRLVFGHPDGLDDPALEVMLAAFRRQGLTITKTASPWARARLASLASWSRCPPTDLRLQDPRSSELNVKLADAALAVRAAIDAVVTYAAEHDGQPETDRVETCQYVFERPEIAEELQIGMLQLEVAARGAGRWARPPGKGRPRLWLLYGFVRELHAIYAEVTDGQKGFSERDGTAKGPFVALVHECQAVLAPEYRHTDIRTTGNRILQALTEESPDDPVRFT